MRIAVITGASSGIGAEFAKQINFKYNSIDEIWLVGRSKEKLLKTAESFRTAYRLFSMDLTEPNQIDSLADEMKKRKAVICMLINSAGFGTMGAFEDQTVDNILGMIDINVRALTEITYKFLPFMRKNSRIIQLASSAAFLPQQDFAVYAATKAYVLSFSKALGVELQKKGIVITSVCPGPVNTPFFDIAEKTGTTLAIKKYTMVSPERVVAQALRDSYHKKSVSVCSLPIKALHLVSKIIPDAVILYVCSLMKG